MDAEIYDSLKCDSIHLVQRKDLHCVLPLSVVPKKGKKFRLILDCQHINSAIVCPSFKQEGMAVVAQQIESDDTVGLEFECEQM